MKALKFMAAALLASTAFASTIAVLDSKAIITGSDAYKAITQLPETKYKAEKAKLDKLRDEYTKAMNQLTEAKLTKAKKDLTAQEAKLQTQRTELTNLQREFGKKVSEDQNTQMKALFDKFQAVVDKYAKANKIDVVLNKYVVITTTVKNIDITDQITKLFK